MATKTGTGLEYKGVASISGPIIVVENVQDVGYDELVTVKTQSGETRLGKVIEVSKKAVIVQVFEGTTGLSPAETRTRFLGHSLEVPVSTEMLGRVMNSFGEPIDGHPRFFTEEKRDVNGYPLNPVSENTQKNLYKQVSPPLTAYVALSADKKLPVFSGQSMAHNELAAQIVRQAQIRSGGEDFNIVFIAMGLEHDDAAFFSRKASKKQAPSKTSRCFLT